MSQKPTYEEMEHRVEELEEAEKRRQVDKTLWKNEEKYRSIFENINDVYYRAGLDGNLIDVSPSGARLLGYDSIEEMIGKNIAEVFYANPQDREHLKKEIVKHGKIIFQGILKRKDGAMVVTETNSCLVYDQTGKPIAVEGIIRDVTERVKTDEMLRESEERFRDTATMLPSVIVEYGLDGTLTYVNPHGYKLAGYGPEDFEEGFNVLQLVVPEEHAKHYDRIQRMMQGEKIPPTEYRLLRKDGSIFWGLVTSSLIHKDGEVVGVRTYTIDISERKEAEEALKEHTRELGLQKKSLEELNTAMKVLLKKREKDKTEIEENVMTNVKELIAPYFDKINETKLDDHQKTLLNILESNLNEIVSPFTRKLSLKYLSLTPKEITIVNMIKIGYPSKKIAKIMKISPRTVDTHRKNIRSKIGLGKKRANLRSHLLAYEQ